MQKKRLTKPSHFVLNMQIPGSPVKIVPLHKVFYALHKRWPPESSKHRSKQKKMSIDRGMDKEDVVHIYNRILLSHKKEQNNTICSNMDGPGDAHTK